MASSVSLQSRLRPYRVESQTLPLSNLSLGHYAGRILECQLQDSSWQVLMFLEDRYYSLRAVQDFALSPGMLVACEVNDSGEIIACEILQCPKLPFSFVGDVARWRELGKPVSRMQRLRWRHQMQRALRDYFDSRAFLEVQTPALVRAPSPEAHFFLFDVGKEYLNTSPEFQMKRLLVGGFERIYQFAPCFRRLESGPAHNPEFTMLEWYRAYAGLEAMASDLEGLIQAAAAWSPWVQESVLSTQRGEVDLQSPWERRSVIELMEEYLGLDLARALDSAQRLGEEAQKRGLGALLENVDRESYEQVFFRLWNTFEPQLGLKRPLFVYDWPLPLASLAQPRQDRPGVAERLELYISGLELANGFGELTDFRLQRQRFTQDLAYRQAQGKPLVPLDEAFLESLEQGLPPCAGMAMGWDRLVMLLTDASSLQEVLCFSTEER